MIVNLFASFHSFLRRSSNEHTESLIIHLCLILTSSKCHLQFNSLNMCVHMKRTGDWRLYPQDEAGSPYVLPVVAEVEAELVTSGDPDRHSYLPALGRSAEYLHYPQYLNISSSSAARRPTRRPSGCCWGRVRTWGEPSPCSASGAPARSGWEQSSSGTTRVSSRGYADVEKLL